MDTTITIGTWVAVRDPSSPFHNMKGHVIAIIGDRASVMLANAGPQVVDLDSLRIPVEGNSPEEEAASKVLDVKLALLRIGVDLETLRQAVDAVVNNKFSDDVMKRLGPAVDLILKLGSQLL